MSDLAVAITGFVVGDDLEIRRTITGLPDQIAKAWMTVKRYAEEADGDAVLAKEITIDDVPGTGCIEDVGGVGVNGILRFDLTDEETRTLGARPWVFDVQIKLEDDKVYTVEKGTIELSIDVTQTTT